MSRGSVHQQRPALIRMACGAAAVFAVGGGFAVTTPGHAAGAAAVAIPDQGDPAPARPVYGIRSRVLGNALMVVWSDRPPPRIAAPPAVVTSSGMIRKAAAPDVAALMLSRRAAPGMALTSGFGVRSDPFGGGRRMHSGLDLAAPLGSPVAATSAGTVIFSGWLGGYGNCVIVDHGGGMQTRYGHLYQIYARVGQTVERGALLGYVGSTGRSTGPHLHYEVRINGRAVNPLGH